MNKIPIIDLFAGPGGLGEGFSSLRNKDEERVFEIKLSIEKDEYAHQTLRLRSFYRQFKKGEVPELYYDYIKEEDPDKKDNILTSIKTEYYRQWNKAEKEAWHFELPYSYEYDKDGNLKGGYSEEEITEINRKIDLRIKEALPKKKDFVLIGGPPCQAYSLVGRSRNQGISNDDHRVHLYKEYLRIIAKHHPAVFVMENVKGLLSAKVDNVKVFDLIKQDLRDPNRVYPEYESPSYKIYSFVKKPEAYDLVGNPIYENGSDFLIKTEKFGVPQRRHRVILLGIREDIKVNNIRPLEEVEFETSLKQVIDSLPKIRSGISKRLNNKKNDVKNSYKKVANSKGNWNRILKSYLNKLDNNLVEKFTEIIEVDSQGSNFQVVDLEEDSNPLYEEWYKDDHLGGVLNHETRTHLMEDLGRYLFSSLHLKVHGDFPKLRDYPEWLLPNHKNAKGGKFADRFRTQKPNQAATTVTSHISKDGHYFIHYDPSQCRSFTVREAARVQTFPDNYYFCGTRTQQFHQVGNAVPPYLALQLSKIVKDIF